VQFRNEGSPEVAYAWHPWAGQVVRLHGIVARAAGSMARCSLIDDRECRVRQFPRWMLDAASCQSMRHAERPVADLGALMALRTLLLEVTAASISAREFQASAIASPHQNRGDHRAPSSSPPTPSGSPARVPQSKSAVVTVRKPSVALAPAPDPVRGESLGDALAGRTRQRRDARSAEQRR
jgi:hypothetical protein